MAYPIYDEEFRQAGRMPFFLTKVPKTVRSMSLSRLISPHLRWEPPPKSKSRFFIWHLFGHKFVVIKEFTSVSNQIGCRILCPLFLMK